MSPATRSRSTDFHPRGSSKTSVSRNGIHKRASRSSSRSIDHQRHRHHASSRHARQVPRSLSRSRSNSRSLHDNKDRSLKDKSSHSRCIGVFGLSVNTTQQKIRDIFEKYGQIERIQVVIDAQTGRSRGFCFIYYENISDAKVAKEQCSGLEIDGRRIRVDYSITQRPHTPTPGFYMGKRICRSKDEGRDYEHTHGKHSRPLDSHSSSRHNKHKHHERSHRSSRSSRHRRSRSSSHKPKRSRY